MEIASCNHTGSKSWGGRKVAIRSQIDGHKVLLKRLPFDIMVKLLSLSLELNLIHTSHTIRETLKRSIGIEQVFSVGAKTIILVALMPPYLWNDRFSSQRNIGFLDVQRSYNTAEHMILQDKVLKSGWFPNPRVFDDFYQI